MLWRNVEVKSTQKAFLYEDGQLAQVLEAGVHRVSILGANKVLETYALTDFYFDNKNAKFLLNEFGELLDKHITKRQLGDFEIGLLYRDGQLVDIFPPGSFLSYWNTSESVHLEMINIKDNFEIADTLLPVLDRNIKANQLAKFLQAVNFVEIMDGQVGLLRVNGKFEKLLPAGRYGFWKYNRTIGVQLVDLRLQEMEVSGQEILTKDRVSLRVNLNATYQIDDAEKVALEFSDVKNFVYKELQLQLREAIGTKSLDELLEDKNSLNVEILASVRDSLKEQGIILKRVGVKDVILPGDMKQILNQVVEAQKQAEANLIKRREETQAMRSLHNTAKLMENNPMLLRLKELDALETITGKIENLSVYGGLDSVLNDLVKLK